MATETIPTAPDPRADVFGMDAGFHVGVRDRAAAGAQNAEAAEEMRAVAHWADLHRTDAVCMAAIEHDIIDWLPFGAGVEGHEGLLRLAGQGAFAVEEFAVCELAAALGLSEIAARAYTGQSLDVRDRLTRCWDQVMAGVLPAWKARQIAEQTIPLGAEAAAYVGGAALGSAGAPSGQGTSTVWRCGCSGGGPNHARNAAWSGVPRLWVTLSIAPQSELSRAVGRDGPGPAPQA